MAKTALGFIALVLSCLTAHAQFSGCYGGFCSPLTSTATLSAVNGDMATLTDNGTASDTITYNASDSLGNHAAQKTTAVMISGVNSAYLHNFTGSNLPHFSTARTNVNAGTSNATILTLGDSTTAGLGGGTFVPGRKAQSYPTQLSQLLTHGSWSSVLGSNNVGKNGVQAGFLFTNYDNTRLATTQWYITNIGTSASGGYVLSGQAFDSISPNTGPLSFTPTNQVDTFVIYYLAIWQRDFYGEHQRRVHARHSEYQWL